MAHKNRVAKLETCSPATDYKWQAEDDERSLGRAAEIVVDRIRLHRAMSLMRKKQKGTDKLIHVLSGRRR